MDQFPIDERYEIDYKKKHIGVAAIFLLNGPDDKSAMGTALKEDYDDFEKLFRDMKFKVLSFHGQTNAKTVEKNLTKVSNAISRTHSCFMCLFIGHGNAGSVSAKDKAVSIATDILPKFVSHKDLKEKPKIFIFQSCRGNRRNETSILQNNPVHETFGSNMLLCYASWNDFVSYAVSSDGHGTQYLQDLHKALRAFTKPENPCNLTDILTVVNRKVSSTGIKCSTDLRQEKQNYEDQQQKLKKRKRETVQYQVPSYETALKKKLFLKIPSNTYQTGPKKFKKEGPADANPEE